MVPEKLDTTACVRARSSNSIILFFYTGVHRGESSKPAETFGHASPPACVENARKKLPSILIGNNVVHSSVAWLC
jgi:hypothetical protein